MKIGLDFDDVTAHFMDPLLEFYNNKKSKNHQQDESKEYDFWVNWGITKEEGIRLIDEFHHTQNVETTKPIEGAIESIKKIMHNGDKLFIITARPLKFKKKIEEWILHHFEDHRIEVISIEFYNGKSATKSQICKGLSIEIMLEDSGKNAVECANEGIKVILFNKPWNQNYSHINITRVDGWQEALQQLQKYSKI